jgi:DNA-binding MarR family transcriptional regulator
MIADEDIARVRAFNRLVTRQIRVLDDRYLGHRPLGECRVLYEIGERGSTPRDVRIRLGLDSGYLARMLRTLQRDGLIESAPDPSDRRTKRLTLTAGGREELRALESISDDLASSALAPLDAEQRERLLRAQAEIRRLLALSMVTIEREDPGSPDARWCIQHYFAELGERFGLDPSKTLPHEGDDIVFLLARFDGQPAGCGVLKGDEIMRMWVDRAHRGLGIAARVLDALETEAAARGLERVRLYTNGSLTEAQAMYRARGYVAIPRYNADPYAERWFEKRLAASRSAAPAAAPATLAANANQSPDSSRASVVSANTSASSAGPSSAAR